MAILYKTTLSKPEGVKFFPPSLENSSYYTSFQATLSNYINGDSDGGDINLMLFNSLSELTTYINSIALTAEQQAELDEWKTANNITITYELFDLTASGTAPPTPFGN